ncbi:hypothetical protein BGZ63DRAFT_425212 [Mariannaea sp. PMI_226]|nr:hypothetical protein BGZ63DRAFT_425212 [Mariannaea sp. PMI_226]
MEAKTAASVWPLIDIPVEIKQLVVHFFSLADSKADDSGERLAAEVFISDGIFMLADGTFSGTDEIRGCRKHAWDTITFRRHEVFKIYINDAGGTDLILIGQLHMKTSDGASLNRQFVARMEIEQASPGPRIRQYRIIDPVAKDRVPYFCT